MKRLVTIFLLLLFSTFVSAQVIQVSSSNGMGPGFAPIQKTKPVNWVSIPGKYVYYNGSSNYAQAVDTGLPIGNATVSVMMWVKEVLPKSSSGDLCFWFGYGEGANYVSYRYMTASGITFTIGGGGSKEFQYPRQLGWTHYTLVTSSTMGRTKVYVNGAEITQVVYKVGTADTALNRALSASGLVFGSHQNLTAKYPVGMAEIAIFNRELSAEEVLRLYPYRLTGKESGLIRLYHCDEATGTTLVDSVGGYNSTMINGPTWIAK